MAQVVINRGGLEPDWRGRFELDQKTILESLADKYAALAGSLRPGRHDALPLRTAATMPMSWSRSETTWRRSWNI